MPTKMDRCVEALIKEGHDEDSAWAICMARLDEDVSDAEYQGEEVEINKPFRTEGEKKKFAVYVKNKRDSVVKVRFGDPEMEIKRDDSERRKSFRARFKCSERKDKTTPAYWSCKLWGDEPVSDIVDSAPKTSFTDKVCFDAAKRYCASVRDGVQEYHASEFDMEGDRMIRVYRSPETVADLADALNGLNVTDEHVELKEIEADSIIGNIFDSELMEHFDEETETTMLIRNGINLSDDMIELLKDGKRELSLGYRGDMIDSEIYDYEVVNIEPHHLALVDNARCGKACTFEDRGKTMKLKQLFADAGIIEDEEGESVNMQKVLELIKELPELVKTASLDEIKALVPILEDIMAKAKEGDQAVETEDDEPEEEIEDAEEDEEDKVKMSDAAFADAVAKKAHAMADAKMAIIDKAKGFLDDGYDFRSKSDIQIMKDAIATQHNEEIADADLSMAFRLLKNATHYDSFGARSAGSADPFLTTGEKEI